MTKHYLFVCSANLDRSPAAQRMVKAMAEQQGLDVEVKSAGLHVQGLYGPPSVQLTRELCDWADEIYVMSQPQLEAVVRVYGQPAGKVRSLDIEDVYGRSSRELRALLEPKLQAILATASTPNTT
jgi:protein-tyrosine-phosphatase